MAKRNKGSEDYPTSMTGWDNSGDVSGVIKLTPEFLEEILDRYEEGDPLVVDGYDDGYATIRFYLGESDYDNCDFLGSCSFATEEKKTRKKRRR